MTTNSLPGAHYADALGTARETAASSDACSTPPSPLRIIEALLFASGRPLTAELAASVIRGLPSDDFQHAIDTLTRDYRRQNRPYAIQPTEQGYVLSLKPRYQNLRERLTGAPREARLSRAAVEVLSLIAFQQPIARSDIDGQRGSDSGALIRPLVRLGLIAALPGKEKEPAYGTTARFLELFGLRSLDDLPRTGDLQLL